MVTVYVRSPLDLGDEQVQVVAAYVIEPRGNESKRLLTFSGPMACDPPGGKRATPDYDQLSGLNNDTGGALVCLFTRFSTDRD